MLWFGVERRYKTILEFCTHATNPLWFGVERRYKTIFGEWTETRNMLWFGVERRYKTIFLSRKGESFSCGLV